VILSELEAVNDKSKHIVISEEEAIESLNYSYHKEKTIYHSKAVSLKNMNASVMRGKYNSKQCREINFKVLHTTDLKNDLHYFDIRSFESTFEDNSMIMVEKGDILIARVGRNITKKICLVTNGKASISDCIYKLRVPERWRETVFKYLISDMGKAALNSRIHGAGARYLSMGMLLELPIPYNGGLNE